VKISRLLQLYALVSVQISLFLNWGCIPIVHDQHKTHPLHKIWTANGLKYVVDGNGPYRRNFEIGFYANNSYRAVFRIQHLRNESETLDEEDGYYDVHEDTLFIGDCVFLYEISGTTLSLERLSDADACDTIIKRWPNRLDWKK
jgi:hypothetical protein